MDGTTVRKVSIAVGFLGFEDAPFGVDLLLGALLLALLSAEAAAEVAD